MKLLWQLYHRIAGIAQLVERNLAKVEVAGSNPVSRSKIKSRSMSGFFLPVFWRTCFSNSRAFHPAVEMFSLQALNSAYLLQIQYFL